jgi:hypothetical protein
MKLCWLWKVQDFIRKLLDQEKNVRMFFCQRRMGIMDSHLIVSFWFIETLDMVQLLFDNVCLDGSMEVFSVLWKLRRGRLFLKGGPADDVVEWRVWVPLLWFLLVKRAPVLVSML